MVKPSTLSLLTVLHSVTAIDLNLNFNIITNNDKLESEVRSLRAMCMENMISWKDYDGLEGNLHFDPSPKWNANAEASRVFQEIISRKSMCSYCNKVLIRISYARVLNQSLCVIPKDKVMFDIPEVKSLAMDEAILMLSFLEIQGLL